MSDQVKPADRGGFAGIIDKVVGALPAQFLLLLLINIGFWWIVLGFLERETLQKMDLVSKFMDACTVAMGRPHT